MSIDTGSGASGDRLLATALFGGVALSMVSARLTLAAVLALLGAAVIVTLRRGGSWRELIPSLGPATIAVLSFVAFAVASTAWAEAGGKAVSKLALVAAIAAAGLSLAQWISESGAIRTARVTRAVLAAFAAGLAFLLIEGASGQAIQIGIYNVLHAVGVPKGAFEPVRHFAWDGDTLKHIELAHINRNFAVASLLAFPAALAAYAYVARPWNRIASAAIVIATVLATSLSRHESSMAALVAGSVALVLASISLTWSRRLLAAGWIGACLLALPAALLAHRAELHKIEGLHHSLAHRIVIWNTTAEETMKAPVLGIGAYMTYVLMPERNKTAERAEGVEYRKSFSRHAHNAYLQTWFELGVVGAVLLAAMGLAILGAIAGLAPQAQPFALATFAATSTMMSASYGLWQTWYLALFALVAVVLAAAARTADQGVRVAAGTGAATGAAE